MESLNTIKLADELTTKQDDILADTTKLNAEAIYQLIDELKVLKHPIQEYFEMSQDEYYSIESDHQLTLLDMNNKLVDLHDRILTNHVDGYVDKDEINLTYNHENPYEDGMYDKKTDFHVLAYSLKVISAVMAVAPQKLTEIISKDAVLSLGLAVYALKHNA